MAQRNPHFSVFVFSDMFLYDLTVDPFYGNAIDINKCRTSSRAKFASCAGDPSLNTKQVRSLTRQLNPTTFFTGANFSKVSLRFPGEPRVSNLVVAKILVGKREQMGGGVAD